MWVIDKSNVSMLRFNREAKEEIKSLANEIYEHFKKTFWEKFFYGTEFVRPLFELTWRARVSKTDVRKTCEACFSLIGGNHRKNNLEDLIHFTVLSELRSKIVYEEYYVKYWSMLCYGSKYNPFLNTMLFVVGLQKGLLELNSRVYMSQEWLDAFEKIRASTLFRSLSLIFVKIRERDFSRCPKNDNMAFYSWFVNSVLFWWDGMPKLMVDAPYRLTCYNLFSFCEMLGKRLAKSLQETGVIISERETRHLIEIFYYASSSVLYDYIPEPWFNNENDINRWRSFKRIPGSEKDIEDRMFYKKIKENLKNMEYAEFVGTYDEFTI